MSQKAGVDGQQKVKKARKTDNVEKHRKVNVSNKSSSEEPFEKQNRKCNLTVYMNMFLTFGGKLR